MLMQFLRHRGRQTGDFQQMRSHMCSRPMVPARGESSSWVEVVVSGRILLQMRQRERCLQEKGPAQSPVPAPYLRL